MTGGAPSIAFQAASRSWITLAFASSTCVCVACKASRNVAISWPFSSSKSVCDSIQHKIKL
jgi:hypothetical protein